jgi:uncharacterized membrane protein YvlD (DUF360 family)
MTDPAAGYGGALDWRPQRPRIAPFSLALAWAVASASLLVAAAVVPGVTIPSAGGAVLTAVLIAVLNAVFPPIVAALRMPFTLVFGFVAILLLDAVMLMLASAISSRAIQVSSFGWALVAALVASAAGVVLDILLGTSDDDAHTIRIVRRIARRQGGGARSDIPGVIFLEIDGLAYPVLQRAMRDGNAPELARWIEQGTHRLIEWETDFSSQTGASQAGILLGSNDDIPAFRWVEKESGRLMVCSAPDDCAEIERRHATGQGLLVNGGNSRGNLLSGEADEVILTVSRMQAEKRANAGYRAFFANGTNVTRVMVLFLWEVVLEWTAALRAVRRDVRPRGHRGGIYPLIRGGICVVVRDLIVFGVLTDMMRGRPAVYATFSSYDEVAHHSGLERADTLEALRKLDQQFGRISRARRYAPRPYEVVVLSDHGQTQGATFKQRNGYGLEDLVRESLEGADVAHLAGGDENDTAVTQAMREATGLTPAPAETASKDGVGDREAVVLGSGNLGLIYLMDTPRRLTLEEIDDRHPRLISALREHPHIGFLLVRSAADGPVALGARGVHYLTDGRVEGDDPLTGFSPNAAQHLLRTDAFAHTGDIMVNSFYDPELDQGCAFEELVSFHGGMGGPQTRAFLLAPVGLPGAEEPIVGAESVHRILVHWRSFLEQGAPAPEIVAAAHGRAQNAAVGDGR